MAVKSVFLSIIIPCYNEEENLERGVLDEVYGFLKDQKYSWEAIVSDDGSSDNSFKIVSDFVEKHRNFKILKNEHGGKPLAIWNGIKVAKGKYILFTDMDQSTPIRESKKILPWFNKKYDVVIGSRGLERKGFPLTRRLMSKIFRFLRGLILLPNINDTQCGFKAFKTRVAREIFPKLQFFQEINKKVRGWRVSAFDVELLFIAQKRGYKIKEVTVSWRDEDISQKKEKKFLKESIEMAKEILRVKINDLLNKYD